MEQDFDAGLTCELVGAVLCTGRDPVDPLLEEVANSLRHAGYRVGGYVQEERTADGCCASTYLRSVADGSSRLITQPLGSGASGCRLDPQRLAEASMALLAELDGELDLLVLNRFGKDEAEGRGFRAVIGKALEKGVPVLTAVREAYAPALAEFASDFGRSLPAERAAIAGWCRTVLGERAAGRTAA